MAEPRRRAASGPRTSFVGRDRELTALRTALAASRLVTVVGSGGAGKTRLIREWLQRDAPAAVVFCDVSDAGSVDAMKRALAEAYGLPRVDDEALLAALRGRLTVLDNLEQLLPAAAATLDAWLVPGDVRLLVSSRAPTHLAGELLVVVDALALGTLSAPHAGDAGVLFVERAQACRPDWTPGDDDWETLATIVSGLDGLPLAIELAASRMRLLTLDEIAAQLHNKLDVMANASQLAPPRHASLRGAVAWSWRLLSEEDRAALRQLAVFRGSFDMQGATALIDHPLERVQSLLDQALLRRSEAGGPARFRLFECVRDYAHEQLVLAGEEDEARGRHDAHFERIAERGLIAELASGVDDLIDVHRRALLPPRDAARALSVALALEPLILGRGPAALLLRLLDEALGATAAGEPLAGAAELARGHVLADMGRFPESTAARERALHLAREASDRPLEGRALASLGRHAWHTGHFDDALRWSDAALVVFDELGDALAGARTRSHRANFRWMRGDLEQARRDYRDALAVLAAHDDRSAEAVALGNLANLEHDMGLLEDAGRGYARAIELLTEVGDRFHRGTFMMNLGGLQLEREERDHARATFEAALALLRETGNRRWEGMAVASLARCDELAGDAERAGAGYVAATELAERFGHPVMLAMVLCWRARLSADRDDVAAAEACALRARAVFDDVGTTVVEGLVDVARAHIALARARAATDTAAHVEVARTILVAARGDDNAAQNGELRMASARLAAALLAIGADAPEPLQEALLVSRSRRGYRAPGGEWHELATRASLWRIVMVLATRRENAPGAALTRSELVAAGWPDERISAEAAAGRVYTAVATLRRMGLRPVLRRRGEGYLLDPGVPFQWC